MKLALVAILAAVPALSQTKVTIAYPVVSTQQIPLWIAHEQGGAPAGEMKRSVR